MPVRSYRDLDVWQKAIELAVECYGIGREFPTDERFALGLQLRRAAVSIAANIAEGHQRRGTREFLRHISIARGSLGETDACLELAERLGHVAPRRLRVARSLIDDVSRMLFRLRQSLASRPPRPASRAPRPAP
jgi:four helix bundle protein